MAETKKEKTERLEEEKAEAKATAKAKKEEEKLPAVGDTVHVVQMNGFHSAALVTKVDKGTGALSLFVTRDDDVKDHYFVEGLPYSEEANPGTWHFIEKG